MDKPQRMVSDERVSTSAIPISPKGGRTTIAKNSLKKSRGWTDGLIADFLGEPDRNQTNPLYRSGPPMQLYYLDRVELAEADPVFQEKHLKLQPRRAAMSVASTKAASAKRIALLQLVAKVPIRVPRYDIASVREGAINSYNSRNYHKERSACAKDQPEFLRRIIINFIRHELTDYDAVLRALKGKVGKTEAYILVKERVMAEIAKVYPEFWPIVSM